METKRNCEFNCFSLFTGKQKFFFEKLNRNIYSGCDYPPDPENGRFSCIKNIKQGKNQVLQSLYFT